MSLLTRRPTHSAADSWTALIRNKLVQIKLLRILVQSLRTARAFDAPRGFLRDQLFADTSASYRVKRTGHLVELRPREDLQVARELLSKDAYAPPARVRAKLIDSAPLIVDLGANIGLFALSEVSRYGLACRVIAVEPDPENVALLTQNVNQNRLQAQISIEQAAAATDSGTATFCSGQNELSHVARATDHHGGGTIEVPAVDAFELLERADLVKIDIEGSEWPILRDPRLKKIPAIGIALEWHDHSSGSDDPRSLARRLLRDAGFDVVVDEAGADHVGFMWGVQTASPDTVDPDVAGEREDRPRGLGGVRERGRAGGGAADRS